MPAKSLALSIISPLTVQDLSQAEQIRHFYCVDFARGLSAIAILVWHYHHFYWTMESGMTVADPRQPFFALLRPLYTDGYWAVQLFWMISGFVFVHVYAQRPSTGTYYFVNRFARLYPLHFFTLILIAVFQQLSWYLANHYQIIPTNDVYHFFLNVFFISHWGFQSAISFNSPVWSVSVEEGIFILFFLLHKRIFAGGVIVPLAIAGMGFAIMNRGTPLWYFGICAFYFFAGCVTYFYLLKFWRRIAASFLIGAACIATFVLLLPAYRTGEMPFTTIEFFLFLPVLLLLGTLDFHYSRGPAVRHRWFKDVGDLTYSSYLLHFPLQVGVLIILEYYSVSRSIFDWKISMILWVVIMLILSRLSFILFEFPAKQYLKKHLPGRLNAFEKTTPALMRPAVRNDN